MENTARIVLLPIPPVLGVDMSITNEVALLWVAALLTLGLVGVACRRRGPMARGGFQNLFEAIIEFVDREAVTGAIPSGGHAWSPFLLALFFFVLFCNLLGIVPVPGMFKAITSNINVTAALALTVFGLTLALNVRRNGLMGFLKKFMPSDMPRPMAVVMVPLEFLAWLTRPLSLALRLFANMLAGHMLIFVFIGMAMGAYWAFKPVPLVGAVLMSGFEIFVCVIQAFVFVMLAGTYIQDAAETHG